MLYVKRGEIMRGLFLVILLVIILSFFVTAEDQCQNYDDCFKADDPCMTSVSCKDTYNGKRCIGGGVQKCTVIDCSEVNLGNQKEESSEVECSFKDPCLLPTVTCYKKKSNYVCVIDSVEGRKNVDCNSGYQMSEYHQCCGSSDYSLYVGSYITVGGHKITLKSIGKYNSSGVVDVDGESRIAKNFAAYMDVPIEFIEGHSSRTDESKGYAWIRVLKAKCEEGAKKCLKGKIEKCVSGSWSEVENCGADGSCDTKGLDAQCLDKDAKEKNEKGEITSDLKQFPYPFVIDNIYKDTILFVGANAPASDTLAMVDVATMLQSKSKEPVQPTTKLDSEFMESQLGKYNIIAFGNSCDNTLIGKFAPEYSCGKMKLKEGHAVIKYTNKFDKGVIIVSGATQFDTRRAAKVLANYDEYSLKEEEVCVIGEEGSFEDIKVKEGACPKSETPAVCGDSICEEPEKETCSKDCKKGTEKCKLGEKQDYICVDGKKISWCSCLNNEWKCINSPESQCQEIKKCDGCYDEKKNCLPYGTRTGSDFCDIDGNFYAQLGDKGICKNNYECQTNLCIDGECVSKGTWNKFLSWFKSIFS